MQTARTTIELDRELLKKAKQRAIEEEKTVKVIFKEALRDYLYKKQWKVKRKVVFKAYPLGVKLPLTREEIYEDI